MLLRPDQLAESSVSLDMRLLRPSTNIRRFLQCILHFSCVVDDTREDPILLPRIFMRKAINLRQLAT
jgi:hypothetical protein